MKSQTGAKYLYNEKKRQAMNESTKQGIIVNHVKRESELLQLPSGAVKRVRRLCD